MPKSQPCAPPGAQPALLGKSIKGHLAWFGTLALYDAPRVCDPLPAYALQSLFYNWQVHAAHGVILALAFRASKNSDPQVVLCAVRLNESCTTEKMNDNPTTISISEPVHSRSNLTGFAEVAPTALSVAEPSSSSPFTSANAGYVSRPVPDSLKNVFVVGTFDWASTSAASSKPYSLRFPEAIFAIPNIAMKLTEYRYFSANVRVRVKINATPFHFGSLGVAFLPRQNPASQRAIGQMLQSYPSAMFLEPGGQESIEMLLERVPITPFDLIDGATCEIGSLMFFVRVPLQQLSGEDPAPIRVTVYASLENVVLAGYGEQNAASKLIRHLVKQLKPAPPPAKKQSGTGGAEAKAKSQSGVISSILDSASSFTPVLAATPLAEFAPFTALAGVAAPFFRSIGLSKPLSVKDITPVSSNSRRGMTLGSGLSIHERLGTHQDATSGDPKHPLLSRPDIRELVRSPTWLKTFYFDETSTPETVLRVLPLTPSLCNVEGGYWYPGMLSYYSQFFQYWRGGIKLKIDFTASQFTSATIRVTHNSYYEATPLIEQTAGNRVSEVVEIRGNTTWSRSFPFLYSQSWAPVIGYRDPSLLTGLDSNLLMSSIEITVVNPAVSSPDATSAAIYYSVYIAADDDFDFKDYVGFKPRKIQVELPAPPAVKQSLRDAFTTKFQSIHPGLCSYEQGWVKSETETNLMELCHKEVQCDIGDLTNYPDYPELPDLATHISMLLNPFFITRGGVNGRIATEIPFHVGMSSTPQAPQYETSAMLASLSPHLSTTVDRVYNDPYIHDITFSVPYKNVNPFWMHWSPLDSDYSPYRPKVEATFAGIVDSYISLADDFMVGLPLLPDRFVVYTPPPVSEPPAPKPSLGGELSTLLNSLPPDIVRGVTSSPLASPKI